MSGPWPRNRWRTALLRLADLGKRLDAVRQVRCKCTDTTKLTADFDFQGSEPDSVDVDFCCGQCGQARRYTFSYDEVSLILLGKDEASE